MKQCFKCGEQKELSEFYKHPYMADGHLGKCKTCTKRDVRRHYSETRAERSAYERSRASDPRRREMKRHYTKQHRLRHPEKARARSALNNAVRDKRVKKFPCVHCGNPKSQAHHTDYSKPLDVVWMCFKCHREKGHGQVVVSAF